MYFHDFEDMCYQICTYVMFFFSEDSRCRNYVLCTIHYSEDNDLVSNLRKMEPYAIGLLYIVESKR